MIGGGGNRTHEKIRVGGVLYVELFCFSPVCEQFVVLPTNDSKLGSHFGGNAYSDPLVFSAFAFQFNTSVTPTVFQHV